MLISLPTITCDHDYNIGNGECDGDDDDYKCDYVDDDDDSDDDDDEEHLPVPDNNLLLLGWVAELIRKY